MLESQAADRGPARPTKAPSRIICIGNRWCESDAAGPRVHDHLAASPLPEAVELVDGGLAGLDLARLVLGTDRVVFVDSVRGFAEGAAKSTVLVLSALEVAAEAEAVPRFDHDSGLPYLLRALPLLGEAPLPAISVVGVEGALDGAVVAEAAATALRLARGVP